MLRGELTLLRARQDDDLPILDAELHADVEVMMRSDSRPWRPIPSGPATSMYRVAELPEDVAAFSVEELATGELAGTALLWGIDSHNRLAHIGLGLRPAFRGRGLASDVVQVLCRYGFTILGLNRLGVETLADNAGMMGAAAKAGFVPEGTLRRSAWVNGEFHDITMLGLLATEWKAS
jgi:RimJ/RimL family protein N-acetyltransferase